MRKEGETRIILFPHRGTEHLKNNLCYQEVDSFGDSDPKSYKARKDLASKKLCEWKKKGSGEMPWNNGLHQRKFIECPGKYIEISLGELDDLSNEKILNNDLKEAVLRFWGEQEWPSSFVKNHDAKNPDDPMFIHTPKSTPPIGWKDKSNEELDLIYKRKIKIGEEIWPSDAEQNDDKNSMGYQNTDPYVFGDKFLYCCCRQSTTTFLQELQTGDIIVFYSGIYSGKGKKDKFECMIDTVFVVGGKSVKYGKNDYSEIEGMVSNSYMERTILPIYHGNGSSVDDSMTYTLYFGATYENPVNGMFSYFPCKTATEAAFPRFTLTCGKIFDNVLNDISDSKQRNIISKIQAKVSQAAKSCDLRSGEEISEETAKQYWLALTKCILEKGYKLGVRAEEM